MFLVGHVCSHCWGFSPVTVRRLWLLCWAFLLSLQGLLLLFTGRAFVLLLGL